MHRIPHNNIYPNSGYYNITLCIEKVIQYNQRQYKIIHKDMRGTYKIGSERRGEDLRGGGDDNEGEWRG